VPFTLIKGRFKVVGASPDGDSIRFFADDPRLIWNLPGPFDSRQRPFAQLRIEGIDALETHYAGRQQPRKFARAARDRLLDFCNVRDVVWDANETTIVSATDDVPGFILSREREKNRRPVAFVFAGTTRQRDGGSVKLTPALMRDSFNFVAATEGLAYPTYYQKLFADLRETLTDAIVAARRDGRGLWPGDGTNRGVDVSSFSVILDDVPIMPKLFRRLSDYIAAKGTAVGFRDALAAMPEPVLDLANKNFTHFDTFVEQADNSTRIRLTVPPEQLVFDPMPSTPTNGFAAMVGAPISGD
jgi:hypothetical protein